MNEEMTQQMMAAAERLATAAEALDRVLQRIDAQQEALNAKVDRIVAAVEEPEANQAPDDEAGACLKERLAELEKANADLKAQAARLARKTMPAAVSALLAKFEGEGGESFDAAVIERTLKPLSVEQRIAVKAEMARAGFIE